MISSQSRRSKLAVALIVAGFVLLALATAGRPDPYASTTYGVSRVEGDPGIAIHWVLCDGQAAEVVDLEGYWGASLPTGVPIYWQVRSEQGSTTGVRVETFVVGQTPPGFYETVPFNRQLPDDSVAISGPPGTRASGGMSFELRSLRADRIYTGDYEHVSPEHFAADGTAHCDASDSGAAPALGLLLLGSGGMLLAGRRRGVVFVIAGLLAALGAFGLAAPLVGEQLARSLTPRGPAQESSAFGRGTTETPEDRRVILEMSPFTHEPRAEGVYEARILAPRSYSFAVSCDGPSIAIGEAAAIQNGSTGSRQLIGCATGQLVRGGIADSSRREELVTIVVDPQGLTDWRVVIVEGEGAVGPFNED